MGRTLAKSKMEPYICHASTWLKVTHQGNIISLNIYTFTFTNILEFRILTFLEIHALEVNYHVPLFFPLLVPSYNMNCPAQRCVGIRLYTRLYPWSLKQSTLWLLLDSGVHTQSACSTLGRKVQERKPRTWKLN